MDNREIAGKFRELAALMELHGENPFRVKSYSNAYQTLRRAGGELSEMDMPRLLRVNGIGKAIAEKIIELRSTGKIDALDDLIKKTPEGIIEILKLKGLGAKKIKLLWDELDIASISDLEYACFENRLLKLKGFGAKTQKSILDQIAFIKMNRGSVLLSVALEITSGLLAYFQQNFPDNQFQISGQIRRKMEVVDRIVIVGTASTQEVYSKLHDFDSFMKEGESDTRINGVAFEYLESSSKAFASKLFLSTGPGHFVDQMKIESNATEEEIFIKNQLTFIYPECRDDENIFHHDNLQEEQLLDQKDIKGIIHAHSNWSDGAATISKMVERSKELGYDYLLLTDHSRSAFYANGLNEDRVLAQWKEIDAINEKESDFKVFKGIESDILSDGNLDYDDNLLKKFDVIIASIHSNLKMDEEKAMFRLLKAIENPYTRILGHLTGRLLLGRPGYPVDHKKIIDACAANQVAIEINCNPHRLDIDWRWLPYAVEKNVEIVLSPDAHSLKGIEDIQYGTWMARKGMVPKSSIINTLDVHEFEKWSKL